MRPRLLAAVVLVSLGLPAGTAAAATPSAALHRITLPAAAGAAPLSVEVPAEWAVREVPGVPGVWIGPPGSRPDGGGQMLQVLPSAAPLDDPERVAGAIRASDEAAQGWSAPRVEVREVGGLRGVLVQLESGEGEAARTTLALKLPAGGGSVDFLLSARRAEFERLRPLLTSILLSARPAAPPASR
jgi:hypothetical protein